MLGAPHRRLGGVRALITKLDIDDLDSRRLALQADLDSKKTNAARNKLGQFATPSPLARDVLHYGLSLLPKNEPVRFLDPAIGTGSFYAALRSEADNGRIDLAVGYEIDPYYGEPARDLWAAEGLDYRLGDFTRQDPNPVFNLLICNPPYVRHHHLSGEEKSRLGLLSEQITGKRFSGLAGLYCYFMAIADQWMAPDGVAGWLIPSEFMDVNYGRSVKRYLLEEVTLLHIHRFDPNDVQFADALVSSAIVWFRKTSAPRDHEVKFTFGGTMDSPKVTRIVPAKALATESKWTRFPNAGIRHTSNIPVLSDFFRVKRGIATGDNGYFILTEDRVREAGFPMAAFRPILPSPRYLQVDEVKGDANGFPLIERRLLLLDPKMSEAEITAEHPALAAYLEEGRQARLHEGYLCSRRSPWYAQEKRDPPPIICTYFGRSDKKSGRPFRFILNESDAIMANVYLGLHPTPVTAEAMRKDPTLIRRIWEVLNRVSPEALLGEGRVYGGGLHKLEPKELSNLPVPEIFELVGETGTVARQGDMLEMMAAE